MAVRAPEVGRKLIHHTASQREFPVVGRIHCLGAWHSINERYAWKTALGTGSHASTVAARLTIRMGRLSCL